MRDSELAIIFRDKQKDKIHLNGRILEPGPFASTMRHTLFREHLGLTEGKEDVDLRDITSDSFYKDVWIRQAAINTSTYDKVSAHLAGPFSEDCRQGFSLGTLVRSPPSSVKVQPVK